MKIDKDKFDIQFIKRTQDLINDYNGDTEFTLLLNCLLGLIIVPNEFNKIEKLKFLNENIKDIEIIQKLKRNGSIIKFDPTHFVKQKRRFTNSRQTFGCFLRKLRNSIAHISNSEPHSEDEKWHSITLLDKNKMNRNNIELKIKLNYDDIRELAEYISNQYKIEKEILQVTIDKK